MRNTSNGRIAGRAVPLAQPAAVIEEQCLGGANGVPISHDVRGSLHEACHATATSNAPAIPMSGLSSVGERCPVPIQTWVQPTHVGAPHRQAASDSSARLPCGPLGGS